MALRAASLKSLTKAGISSDRSLRGGDQAPPATPGVIPLSVEDNGASPLG